MRSRLLIATLLTSMVLAAGCGWSRSPAPMPLPPNVDGSPRSIASVERFLERQGWTRVKCTKDGTNVTCDGIDENGVHTGMGMTLSKATGDCEESADSHELVCRYGPLSDGDTGGSG